MRWMNAAPIARLLDHVAARAIHFEPADLASLGDALCHQRDRGVSPVACGGERSGISVRHGRTCKPHPRDVSKHRAGLGQLAPQIEQDDLVLPYLTWPGGIWSVMRVAGVLLDRDDRGGVCDEPFVPEPAQHCLLEVDLGKRPPGRARRADQLEGPILDAVQPLGGRSVRRIGLLGPDRLEPLHEIARRGDVDVQMLNGLHRSRVNPRNIGDRVAWRVLHRHAFEAAEHVAQARRQRLALRVGGLGAREMIEVVRLDGVDKLARFAAGRNHVEPPSGRQLRAAVEPGEPAGDGVGSVEVVQQPPVERFLFQCALNSRDGQGHLQSIRGQISIF